MQITPVDSAFVSSTLHLQNAPQAVQESVALAAQAWYQCPLTMAFGALSLLTCILMMRQIVSLIPSLVGCILRSKEMLNLQNSARLSRERDMVAMAALIPLCLVATHYRFLDYDWLEGHGLPVVFGFTAGLMFAFGLVKSILSKLLQPRILNAKSYAAVTHGIFTFTIIITEVLLLTVGVLDIIAVQFELAKTILLWEMAALYLICILHKYEILRSRCSVFATILYLCAADFLPTGAVIATVILF